MSGYQTLVTLQHDTLHTTAQVDSSSVATWKAKGGWKQAGDAGAGDPSSYTVQQTHRNAPAVNDQVTLIHSTLGRVDVRLESLAIWKAKGFADPVGETHGGTFDTTTHHAAALATADHQTPGGHIPSGDILTDPTL